MNAKKILYGGFVAALMVFELAPSVQASYNTPFIFGALTGDVTSTGNNSYATKVQSYNNGTAFGSLAAVNVGFNPGYQKLTTGSTYTTLATDTTICVNKTTGSATAVVLTVPTTVPTGQTREWNVKDCKGDAATNNITVTMSNAATIDGAASYVITNPLQNNVFKYDGTTVGVY